MWCRVRRAIITCRPCAGPAGGPDRGCGSPPGNRRAVVAQWLTCGRVVGVAPAGHGAGGGRGRSLRWPSGWARSTRTPAPRRAWSGRCRARRRFIGCGRAWTPTGSLPCSGAGPHGGPERRRGGAGRWRSTARPGAVQAPARRPRDRPARQPGPDRRGQHRRRGAPQRPPPPLGTPYLRTVTQTPPTLVAQLTALPGQQVPVGVQTTATAGAKPTPPRSSPSAPDRLSRRRPGSSGRAPSRPPRTRAPPERLRHHRTAAHQPAPPTSTTPSAATGRGRTRCPGSATSSSTKPTARSAPATRPRVLASLRNLAIVALHLTAVTNTAAARRHHAHRPNRPLSTITTR